MQNFQPCSGNPVGRLMGRADGRYTATPSEGDWLSWLERTVHIREVTGSNPVSPTNFAPLSDA